MEETYWLRGRGIVALGRVVEHHRRAGKNGIEQQRRQRLAVGVPLVVEGVAVQDRRVRVDVGEEKVKVLQGLLVTRHERRRNADARVGAELQRQADQVLLLDGRRFGEPLLVGNVGA